MVTGSDHFGNQLVRLIHAQDILLYALNQNAHRTGNRHLPFSRDAPGIQVVRNQHSVTQMGYSQVGALTTAELRMKPVGELLFLRGQLEHWQIVPAISRQMAFFTRFQILT